jgi:enoyl-CoA hydratase/carnithine racemase
VADAREPLSSGRSQSGESSTRLSREADRRIATLDIGSGTRHNALSTRDWVYLAELITEFRWDSDLRAVVVRGRRDSFCAGSDVHEWQGATLDAVNASFDAMETAFQLIEAIPVPVVAQMRGVAVGAGLQLALACDLRICTPEIRLGMPIAGLGILATDAFARRIVAQARPSTAYELLYTGRLVDGREAHRMGLVSAVAPADRLDAETNLLLDTIAQYPVAALRAAKLAVLGATGYRSTPTVPTAAADDRAAAADLQQLHAAVNLFTSRRDRRG